MDWLAHSARRDRPAQTYRDHILRAIDIARSIAADASAGLPESESFVEMVALGIEHHDIGKLDDDNQAVLASPDGGPLPCEHVDAGVKHLFGLGTATACYAGMLAYSHHRGLPDAPAQKARGVMAWRGDDADGRFAAHDVVARTSAMLPVYLARHHEALSSLPAMPNAAPYKPQAIDLRMALSCLVDADHSDTARHYGAEMIEAPSLMPDRRLQRLDEFVKSLPHGNSDAEIERAALRRALYESCKSADTSPSILECDAPVGSGKTAAVMAHLLRAAHAKGLRRVFVVQPYTTVIDQSVVDYRDALVLRGETAEHVVAAHHHKSDFSGPLTRALTTRWQAPIIVTTAVQFFESLASNRTASLRKLHQVARSAIFVDEAHSALPSHLWPMAWQWLRQLAERWGCHIVFASGSLARFWTLDEFYRTKPAAAHPKMALPKLVDDALSARLSANESRRVAYRQHTDRLNLPALLDLLIDLPGPRIAVFNTVQTAAIVALAMQKRVGKRGVEHLSTALTPADRETTLSRVKARLKDGLDTDWTLIATSMVESGVNLSFRSGVREAAGLASLLQLGGRVNRHNEYGTGDVWTVSLMPAGGIRDHRAMQIPAAVLAKLYSRGMVSPDNCTKALGLELKEAGNPGVVATLFNMDASMQYAGVADSFKVIASDTVTALPPGPVLDAIRRGERPSWQAIQSHSVQIWSTKQVDFGLVPLAEYPDMFGWSLDYDAFIGYMAGALEAQAVQSGATLII